MKHEPRTSRDRAEIVPEADMTELVTRQLARLYESEPDAVDEFTQHPGLYRRVVAVLSASEALGDHLIACPQAWRALRPEAARELDEVRGARDKEALRVAHRQRLAQISADDLTGDGDVRQVTAELSELADAALEAGLRIATREYPGDARVAVIAMGKTGGRELNYLSDVDVMFVAQGDLHIATRRAAAVSELVGQVAWQVDVGLRPEGRNGALVRTVDSYLNYYRRWANTWEFQALMKARPAAGDLELGTQWAEAVAPLVWSTADSQAVVDEIRAMRRRVLSELPAAGADRELKLGPGGLRDIEFAVQLMQLVHGRSDESLRVRSTLDSLDALSAAGYLGRADGVALTETYRFLRTVEHRLQLQKLRRTHHVPDEPAALYWLARTLGFRDVGEFRKEWRRHASTARRLHEKLFYRPLLEAVAEVPSEGLRLTTESARSRLDALGFADPAGALRHISALVSGISRTAAIQRTLLPVLLGEFAAAPEPDRGLLAYRQVSDKLGRTPWYLRLLRDGGPIALRLARLLGTSRYLTQLLLRDPAALRLLSADADLAPRSAASLREGMAAAADRHRRSGDVTAAVAAVRAIRRRELLRIACADLLGRLEVTEVGEALSDVTDAVLHTTLRIAMGELDTPVPIAVIGMGRLGSRECSYSSDADVLFVHEDDSPSQSQAARATVERLRGLLSAPAHEPPLNVDADLRPEGRQGPIARSLAAYQRYYQRWSRVWESQALLRARYVAGDADVASRLLRLADELRFPEGGLGDAHLVELRRVKARVDTERLPRGADRATHVKLGPGGLTDVEWTVQLLQLRYGHDHPDLRVTSTLDALAAAVNAGLLGSDDAQVLRHAWWEASRIRNGLMLSRATASDQLPRHGAELAGLLATLSDTLIDPGEFVDEYLRAARRAHAVAERIFYEDDVTS